MYLKYDTATIGTCIRIPLYSILTIVEHWKHGGPMTHRP